jgi:CheY-like chemotaxis protein
MIRPDKILAVDDDPAILNIYRELLAADGLDLRTAETMTQAITSLDEGDWAVVLLDQKLRGAGGADEGLTLIEEVERRSPGSKTLIVTGYASPEAIEQAFAAGAYDYVEKTETFETLLRVKVRNATELAREQALANLSADAASTRLAQLWADARSATDSARKGRLLEDLVELVLKQIPGFIVTARRRGADEEFDLVVRNESSDPLWSKDSQYFLVECKNWNSKVGPAELDRFVGKLERRYGRGKLGFFVAPNGFTAGFRSELLARRYKNVLVVPIDDKDLLHLVEASDRNDLLKQLHHRAIETAVDK